MITKNRLIIIFAWLQLFISFALAATVVWGYMTYQASLGQFTQSVAASIAAISNVVGRTAETIEAKQSFLDQIGKTLLATRNLVKEIQVTVANQSRIAPQYIEGVRAASDTMSRLSVTFQSVGDGMMFTVPTGIEWHGMKPVVVKSRPLEKQAQAVKIHAKNFKVVSDNLSIISATIGRDGENLSMAFMATSEQALKLIEETEKMLGRLKSNDLPKALVDLKVTSENLRNVSEQVNIAGNVSEVFWGVGFLLAGWCFFNSLYLILVGSKTADFRDKISMNAKQ